MSGIEVAGLVLGAMPLLMEAIQAYGRQIRHWKAAAHELQSLNRQLLTEKTKLGSVCELLIADIVPVDDIEPMLKEPFGDKWRSADTVNAVRRRLWDSYDLFENATNEVWRALDSMSKRLKVQISPKETIQQTGKRQITRQFKKFLFCLKRDQFQNELAAISKGVRDMETLVQQGTSLEPTRKKRSRGKLYKILRDSATSVYRALDSNIRCNDRHDMCLELATRIIEVGHTGSDEEVRCRAKFKLIVSFEMAAPADENSEEENSQTETRRYWDELSIQGTAQPLPPSNSINAPEEQKSPVKTEKVSSLKRVKFSLPITLSSRSSTSGLKPASTFSNWSSANDSCAGSTTADEASTTCVMTTEIEKTEVVRTFSTEMPPQQATPSTSLNLCTALKDACGTSERPVCYGHLVDCGCGKERRFQVSPIGATSYGSDSWSTVTLGEVLLRGKGLRPLVSLAEKANLALAIGSSLLQLSKTPWLAEGLTHDDVYFIRRNDTPLAYDEAFLMTAFQRSQTDYSNHEIHQNIDIDKNPRCHNNISKTSRSSSMASILTNNALFSLGILLLEIILGEPFEKLRALCGTDTTEYGGNDYYDRNLDDLDKAHKILDMRVRGSYPGYAAAVQLCIDCNQSTGLDDDKFRQDVYNSIVLQLEQLVDSSKLGR